ncbi:MAG: lysylphosphatidylglycerol synthase transmembrane domain-containing protein [Bacteroidota bacterium]
MTTFSRHRRQWILAFRIVSTVLALVYVGWKLYDRRAEMERMWGSGWEGSRMALLGVVIGLMGLNYALEAQKWRIILKPFYAVLSLGKSVVAVFAGMAAGVFTPNRIGEYAGRILFLAEGRRVEAIVATFIDRICQLLVTLVTGFAAFGGLIWRDAGVAGALLQDPGVRLLFVIFTLAMTVFIGLFLAAPGRLAGLLPGAWSKSEWVRKLKYAMEHLPWRLVRRVLGLSFLRYMVFSSQYVLLMLAFGYQVEDGLLLAYCMVALIFLGKSVLPVMGIFELGVRESVAILVMSYYGVDPVCAFSSTFLLYLINILLPTLIGVVALQRIE